MPQLLDALEGFLASLRSLDSHAVVVIDEAQSLPADVLDQIRLLTALERDGQRLIQIVLCGQPMLLKTLKTEPMYALNERMTRRVALMPLPPAEVAAYIKHRLAVAGGTSGHVRAGRGRADRRAVARPAAARQRAVRPRAAGRPHRGRVDHHAGDGEAGGASRCVSALDGARARERAEARRAEREGRERDPRDTFWQSGCLALAASRRRPRLPTLALVGALGYGYYARGVVSDGPGIPARPAAPKRGSPPGDDHSACPRTKRSRRLLESFGRGSGQLPDDRHELD